MVATRGERSPGAVAGNPCPASHQEAASRTSHRGRAAGRRRPFPHPSRPVPPGSTGWRLQPAWALSEAKRGCCRAHPSASAASPAAAAASSSLHSPSGSRPAPYYIRRAVAATGPAGDRPRAAPRRVRPAYEPRMAPPHRTAPCRPRTHTHGTAPAPHPPPAHTHTHTARHGNPHTQPAPHPPHTRTGTAHTRTQTHQSPHARTHTPHAHTYTHTAHTPAPHTAPPHTRAHAQSHTPRGRRTGGSRDSQNVHRPRGHPHPARAGGKREGGKGGGEEGGRSGAERGGGQGCTSGSRRGAAPAPPLPPVSRIPTPVWSSAISRPPPLPPLSPQGQARDGSACGAGRAGPWRAGGGRSEADCSPAAGWVARSLSPQPRGFPAGNRRRFAV